LPMFSWLAKRRCRDWAFTKGNGARFDCNVFRKTISAAIIPSKVGD
jgi:hypothetical protein